MPAGERAEGSDPGQPGGAELGGLIADLRLAVGQLIEQRKPEYKPRIPLAACHPVPFAGPIALAAGAGTLNQADLYGPKDGYWWDVRSLTFSGFTAGSISVFRNNANGEPLGTAPAVGELTWSAQKFLAPRDTMIFVASGITLAAGASVVTVYGWAVEVATDWLADYLV